MACKNVWHGINDMYGYNVVLSVHDDDDDDKAYMHEWFFMK